MATEPRPWVEWHETEGFCGRGFDHLPYVNSHGVVDHFKFVHERDIDCPEHVLGNLGGFSYLNRWHLDHFLENRAIKGFYHCAGVCPHSSDKLWNSGGFKTCVTGVCPFWRESEKKISTSNQAGRFQNRLDDLICCSGKCC